MEKFDLYQFLLESNPTRVYYDFGGCRDCWHNSGSIYFQQANGGFYDRFSLNDNEKIANYLSHVVRVEKSFDGEYYPIWTREDGVIEDFTRFVKVRGKYYSIKQLESIFERIETLKTNVNTINL
ncbi:MAG: hypothetical protein IJV27_08595 [Prevotella sp.]|nr:hypothetical protein [Prevotella sp.]